jgi:hypothetical protein
MRKRVDELQPGDVLVFRSDRGLPRPYTIDRVEPAPDHCGEKMVRVIWRELRIVSSIVAAATETEVEI